MEKTRSDGIKGRNVQGRNRRRGVVRAEGPAPFTDTPLPLRLPPLMLQEACREGRCENSRGLERSASRAEGNSRGEFEKRRNRGHQKLGVNPLCHTLARKKFARAEPKKSRRKSRSFSRPESLANSCEANMGWGTGAGSGGTKVYDGPGTFLERIPKKPLRWLPD